MLVDLSAIKEKFWLKGHETKPKLIFGLISIFRASRFLEEEGRKEEEEEEEEGEGGQDQNQVWNLLCLDF